MASTKNKFDFTLALTAHDKGVLAHKTMQSVLAAAKLLDAHKISYEILVHLDRADTLTKKVFKSYEAKSPAGRAPLKNLRLLENSFGDLGLSRNAVAKAARGEFLTFLDADDLISADWYYAAYKKLKQSKKPVLVHPEYNLSFGVGVVNQLLWRQLDSLNRETETLLLLSANLWAAVVAGPREIFLKHPYPETGRGYGNEDWWFNSETLAAGVRHVVAKNAVQFYRKKPTSLLSESVSKNYVQKRTALFDIKSIKNLDLKKLELAKIRPDLVEDDKKPEEKPEEPEKETPKKSVALLKSTLAYRAARRVYRSVVPPPPPPPIPVVTPPPRPGDLVPAPVLRRWREINAIESQLYPTEANLWNLEEFHAEHQIDLGLAFADLVRPVTRRPDLVFLVPWFTVGGADKLLLNYLAGLKKIAPRRHVAVITTLPGENRPAKDLPGNVDLIDFGNAAAPLASDLERERLLSRLLEQLACPRLHILNSEFAYLWTLHHLDLVRNNYTLDLSLFGRVPLKETLKENPESPNAPESPAFFDYADPYAVSVYSVVHKIYTDNTATVERCVRDHGFDPQKFVVEYQPLSLEPLKTSKTPKPRPRENGEPLKILWASRVATPKHPELLKAIAKNLDPEKFQIDMFGALSPDYSAADFADLPALAYRGPFKSFEKLHPETYDLFLYTSLNDGLPNILLEAAAAGLPILASDAGGVRDFVKDKETGLLVSDLYRPDPYLSALAFARENPAALETYAKNAKDLLKTQHSPEKYLATLRKHFDWT